MRDDDRFEIQRAFDLLPHVIGSSWAVTWFRLNGIKSPTRDQYHDKVVEYVETLRPLVESYGADEKFAEIYRYSCARLDEEIRKVRDGQNKEVEKRYDRYVDYG